MVLVAASPCALAISVPITVVSGIGAGTKFGVVIKSGAAFEELGTVKTVVFDKTGTLTRNKPEVVSVHVSERYSREQILALAAALESSSSHPLAEAVLQATTTRLEATDVQEHSGHGVSGTVDGRAIRVGSPRWIDPEAFETTVTEMSTQGMSIMVVSINGDVAGVLGIRDELRPEAVETVAELHRQGYSTVILTGDNAMTADAIAAEAGITEVHANQLPQDKAAFIERISRNQKTAMIGDGINDAPALAAATVGIAMGATGSAAAVESADVAFTGNDLRLIPEALAHARKGHRIMTGNIAIALAIIILLFPLALFGILGLAAVVLIHELAEVVVIGNGIRAARTKRRLERSTVTGNQELVNH